LGALVLLAALGVVALLAPWIAPYDPDAVDFADRFSTPSAAHWLGTDDLGRDLLSRLCFGARVSLRASFQVVLTALSFALPIGLLAGYLGGRIDDLLMRLMDAVLSFPPLILAIAVAGILGPGLTNLMIAISILFIPGFARVIRAQTLAVRQETFIEASIAAGTQTHEILRRRVLPNVASPLIVQASLALGVALLAEAGLSFLGLGLQPPAASWGAMLRRAHQFIFTDPWLMLAPGLAIASTVLAFNTVGDGLRDALGIARSAQRRASGALGLTPTLSPAPATDSPSEPLLSVSGLTIELTTAGAPVKVVEDLDFHLARGEILGLVGESGAGKTMTALAIMRLIPAGFGRIARGSVHFEGRDLLSLPFSQMRRVRGGEIAMIFQDPMSSLNPVYSIGDQIAEAVMLHEGAARAVARRRALEMLDRVGIPEARRRMDQYPHQFSGGMRQRAMLAMALSCRPRLLIADEPTTALDVTIQAQILDLLRSLQRELGLAVLFVTHDLGVVADVCDRVAVMYAGQLVEEGPLVPFFERPRHPYSEGLLAAMPRMSARDEALYAIPGQVPPAGAAPLGCRFQPRCRHAQQTCRVDALPLASAGEGRRVRCLRYDELELGGTS
jgi:peptide/nickel transport system permease protein